MIRWTGCDGAADARARRPARCRPHRHQRRTANACAAGRCAPAHGPRGSRRAGSEDPAPLYSSAGAWAARCGRGGVWQREDKRKGSSSHLRKSAQGVRSVGRAWVGPRMHAVARTLGAGLRNSFTSLVTPLPHPLALSIGVDITARTTARPTSKPPPTRQSRGPRTTQLQSARGGDGRARAALCTRARARPKPPRGPGHPPSPPPRAHPTSSWGCGGWAGRAEAPPRIGGSKKPNERRIIGTAAARPRPRTPATAASPLRSRSQSALTRSPSSSRAPPSARESARVVSEGRGWRASCHRHRQGGGKRRGSGRRRCAGWTRERGREEGGGGGGGVGRDSWRTFSRKPFLKRRGRSFS